MQPKPPKQPATYPQQIETLRCLGVVVSDEPYAEEWLRVHSYYRYACYLDHFMVNGRVFIPSLPFEYVTYIYAFDRELRALLLSGMEIIQDYARSVIAYVFSHFHGIDGHYDPRNFENTAHHEKFLARFAKERGGRVPLRIMLERMPFTALSQFYANIEPSAKREVARQLGLSKADVLKNWLHALSVLSNRCARSGRLYNTRITPKIRIGRRLFRQSIRGGSLCAAFYAAQALMPADNARVHFIESLIRLIQRYERILDFSRIGLTDRFKNTLEGFLWEGKRR